MHQLINIAIWALFTFNFTLGGPTPLLKTSSDLTSPIDARGEAADHGPPYCTPTGPGTCNLAFYSRVHPDGIRTEMFVYNRFCRLIGHTHANIWDWTNFYSELPYTIVARFRFQDFWYAGHYTASRCGYSYFDTNGHPLPPAHIRQCAFDCGTGGWDHGRTIGNSDIAGPANFSAVNSIDNANISEVDSAAPNGVAKRAPSELAERDTASHNHGPPYCTPTGPGTCNLAFYRREHPDGLKKEIFVYNRFCRLIGHVTDANPFAYTNFYSELAYTIVAIYRWHEFWYAGGRYGPSCGFTYQDTNGHPLPPASVTQCAFDCGSGGWDHARTIDESPYTNDSAVVDSSTIAKPPTVQVGEEHAVPKRESTDLAEPDLNHGPPHTGRGETVDVRRENTVSNEEALQALGAAIELSVNDIPIPV